MKFGKPAPKSNRFGKGSSKSNIEHKFDLNGVQVGLSEWKPAGATEPVYNIALSGGADFGKPLFLSYGKAEWLAANMADVFKRLTAE